MPRIVQMLNLILICFNKHGVYCYHSTTTKINELKLLKKSSVYISLRHETLPIFITFFYLIYYYIIRYLQVKLTTSKLML